MQDIPNSAKVYLKYRRSYQGACLIRPPESSEVENFKSSGAEDRPVGACKPDFEKKGWLWGSGDPVWRKATKSFQMHLFL